MKILGVIPARYKSSRFPGKPLVNLVGKPMVLWVAEAAAKALGRKNVFIATDDDRICQTVESSGFKVVMTPDNLLTGTDRVACVAHDFPADIYLNIQGDEPLLDPSNILKVVEVKKNFCHAVVNAMAKVLPGEDVASVHLPKVVFNEQCQLVYMSRLAVPGSKQGLKDGVTRYKQVCIYAFNRGQLDKFKNLGRKSHLEEIEDIEILRFLDLDIPVQMCEVIGGSLAVDVPEDVEKVETTLKKMTHVR